MVVVHDVDDGVRQVDLVHTRHCVGAHHGDSLVAEELGQAVMDERVVVVGARGEHHGVGAGLLCLLDHHGAACLQGCREALLRGVALGHGGQAGCLVDAPGLGHVRAELALAVGLGVPVEQRVFVARAAFLGVVGVAHHHGVALHHRAHALACGMGVLGFDRGDRGHEDEVDAGRLELADVAVHELGGEAHGVGGDGGQALLVHATRGGAAHADLKSQRPPERLPERQRVPIAEHERDAHDLALALAQRFDLVVAAKKLQALVEEVGGVLALGAGRRSVEVGAARTAVAGDPGGAVGELHDRARTVVGAVGAHVVRRAGVPGRSRARSGVGRYRAVVEGVDADEAGLPFAADGAVVAHLALHMVAREQGGAERAHELGIGGAGDLAAHVLLKAAQHGVVAERAALHHDVLAELVHVGHADDLGEDVLYDGAAQARHDVVGGLARLLLADDGAVHEDGAARAQVCRALGGEGVGGDLLHGNVQRGAEALKEAAAAARARLVHGDVRDDAVVEPDGLHVLAADVEDERHLGGVKLGCLGMCHGLYHVAVGAQGAGAQLLAVAGGAHGADDEFGVGLLEDVARLKQGAAHDLERFALVRGVEGVDEMGVVVHQDELGGGGAAVDAQVGVGGRSRHGVGVGALRQAVTDSEALQLRLVGKEGLQFRQGVGATALEGGERLDARGGVEGAGVVGEERG